MARGPSKQAVTTTETPSRRAHPRYALNASILVSSARGDFDAELRDLSLGGARFVSSRETGAWGDPVHVLLPSSPGASSFVNLPATIVRTEAREGQHTIAVRFDALATPEMDSLTQLLLRTRLRISGKQ
jgi:hypothetical protein